jgi:hypothetical protein
MSLKVVEAREEAFGSGKIENETGSGYADLAVVSVPSGGLRGCRVCAGPQAFARSRLSGVMGWKVALLQIQMPVGETMR